ncbi:hypothetical protein [Methanosphaera sp. WGK6]|uniref:hypothetical protein n=1 Tax=Methanosphaera sp. WGK6 TaxID=1561964 RepID=UPI0013017C69|nr:hypothetical protein [Methanosphaera sp. WGK6]
MILFMVMLHNDELVPILYHIAVVPLPSKITVPLPITFNLKLAHPSYDVYINPVEYLPS